MTWTAIEEYLKQKQLPTPYYWDTTGGLLKKVAQTGGRVAFLQKHNSAGSFAILFTDAVPYSETGLDFILYTNLRKAEQSWQVEMSKQ